MRTLYGEDPGTTYDSQWWSAVHQLFEEAFPGLPASIDRARRIDAHWEAFTTPFACFEGDRCLAHVGVLEHPMQLRGEPTLVLGIHAVCTAQDHRRQGLARELLQAALRWGSTRGHTLAKLHTDDPEVYTGRGFVSHPTFRFRSTLAAEETVPRRPLHPLQSPTDAELLRARLADRATLSALCTSDDDGWLILTDATLTGRLETSMHYLPAHDTIVVFDQRDDYDLLVEVIAPELPPAQIVRAAAPRPHLPMLYSFTPDLIEPQANPQPAPASIGHFMVRGPWPLTDEPIGISPLWEH